MWEQKEGHKVGGRTGGQEMGEGVTELCMKNVTVTAITLYANFRKLIKNIEASCLQGDSL